MWVSDDIAKGVSFTLSIPGVHGLCTPGDPNVMRRSLDAAETFTALDPTAREVAIREAASLPSIFPMPVA